MSLYNGYYPAYEITVYMYVSSFNYAMNLVLTLIALRVLFWAFTLTCTEKKGSERKTEWSWRTLQESNSVSTGYSESSTLIKRIFLHWLLNLVEKTEETWPLEKVVTFSSSQAVWCRVLLQHLLDRTVTLSTQVSHEEYCESLLSPVFQSYI